MSRRAAQLVGGATGEGRRADDPLNVWVRFGVEEWAELTRWAADELAAPPAPEGRLFEPAPDPGSAVLRAAHSELLDLAMLLAGRPDDATWAPVKQRARRALRLCEEMLSR